MVDVIVSARFDASPASVAAVIFDAANDPSWIGGAKEAVKLSAEPCGVGTRVRRCGGFLSRSFSWVTEITEFVPDRAARMIYVAGPFKGGVDHTIVPDGAGSVVTICNCGQSSFWFPFMAAMLRASVAGDLRRLEQRVECR